jgi:hypothetical protein
MVPRVLRQWVSGSTVGRNCPRTCDVLAFVTPCSIRCPCSVSRCMGNPLWLKAAVGAPCLIRIADRRDSNHTVAACLSLLLRKIVLIQSLDLDCVYVADAYSEFDHIACERRTINQDD